MSPPPMLFHYTSQKGLLGIVGERCLWLTDVRYMNDSTEFTLAVELLANRIDELTSNDGTDQGERNLLIKVLQGVRYSTEVDSNLGLAGAFALSEHPDQLSQ